MPLGFVQIWGNRTADLLNRAALREEWGCGPAQWAGGSRTANEAATRRSPSRAHSYRNEEEGLAKRGMVVKADVHWRQKGGGLADLLTHCRVGQLQRVAWCGTSRQ